MSNDLVLEMIEKHFVTDMLVLTIEYDVENLKNSNYKKFCIKGTKADKYGRTVPKPAHGTYRLESKISSTRLICDGFIKLYDSIINKNLLIRKIYLTVGNLADEAEVNNKENQYEQVNLFTNYKEIEEKRRIENEKLTKEKNIQKAIIEIKNKYGKNAIIKAMDLEEDATAIERNGQIGGHKG